MAFEILKSTEQNVTKFKEIYEQDRFRARIFCFEHTPQESILSINDLGTNNFQIFRSIKKYGVSKTMKLFARKSDTVKYIVSPKGFYRVERKILFPVCLNNIESDILEIFTSRFSWIRFLKENNLNSVLFNSVLRYKLYSRDKVLRHIYGCVPSVAMKLMEHYSAKDWKVKKKSITNVDNFNFSLFDDVSLLDDTIVLAFKMNEYVNASWSVRRLTEEHDRLSKQYTDIVAELTNRPLNLHPVFRHLSDFLGGGLLTTTKELAIEGQSQKHCVASYSHHVDSGRTAIFHINGFTAEIINKGKSFELRQFKGVRNLDAPTEMRILLNDKINKFSMENPGLFDLKHTIVKYEPQYSPLPF